MESDFVTLAVIRKHIVERAKVVLESGIGTNAVLQIRMKDSET